MDPALVASRYHQATKHHFSRFARSLGYLDWATQPDPFRRYAGAPALQLPRAALTDPVPYRALFEGGVPSRPLTVDSLGEFLRCSMGLSAWKQFGSSRWALRVNPSSGNLHPTETYVVWQGRVFHYAPQDHLLEERCVVGDAASSSSCLVGLTSIHWREAWKYGERAFRYCQHDAGHAIAALRLAAALLGWRLRLLEWPHADVATLLGVGRDEDAGEAEREEPECLAVLSVDGAETDAWPDRRALVEAAGRGQWQGRANRLSPEHVPWPIIDEVAAATRGAGTVVREPVVESGTLPSVSPQSRIDDHDSPLRARAIILQRRSALSFDPRGTLPRAVFGSMLRRLLPPSPPWDAIGWGPQVHLVLFVHRVDGLVPGIYACLRDARVLPEWRAAMRQEFLWERMDSPDDPPDLFLLVPIDCRRLANRVSCDQDIAADGFFSLGMLARFEAGLRDHGGFRYRQLFWECGMIGQVLYLEAEAAGARATGIGCFYDDPVHELLGLSGDAWQSLYHFSMGIPREDARLTTEPGYWWESDR